MPVLLTAFEKDLIIAYLRGVHNMKNKLKLYIKEELRGWNIWEILWLISSCLIIIALSLYWNDSLMGIISATSGVAYVIFTGKGKLLSFFFGIINALLYALISWEAKFYGEVMLNLLYYFPMQFYGFYVWSKNMNPETHEVIKRRMTKKGRAVLWSSIALGTLVYGFVLKLMGGQMPFIDSLSTVTSVVALVCAIKMYAEQWMLWTVVNAVTVVMWGFAFAKGSESVATLVMWVLYLVNGVVLHIKWSREANNL